MEASPQSGHPAEHPKNRDASATIAAMSKIHILGIAGTFMGGVAALARELGHTVEGSDQAVYPPMSPSPRHRCRRQ